MPKASERQILLTNDDGIDSEGLWAAAEALSELGFVTVAAPREQFSGAGRSMPLGSDGVLREEEVTVHGVTWEVYAVGGSPAQTVQHGILELMPRPPDLLVAGINRGENLTVSITISGTVGAALEAASFGVPALAVSLEMPKERQRGPSGADFSAAAHFTKTFASYMLESESEHDIDVLNVNVPSDATPETPWQVTRLSRTNYYVPLSPERESFDHQTRVDFEIRLEEDQLEPDSDVYVVRLARKVSVTPLSLDMTSRVDLTRLEEQLKAKEISQRK
jgi:5'-nucleotidase